MTSKVCLLLAVLSLVAAGCSRHRSDAVATTSGQPSAGESTAIVERYLALVRDRQFSVRAVGMGTLTSDLFAVDVRYVVDMAGDNWSLTSTQDGQEMKAALVDGIAYSDLGSGWTVRPTVEAEAMARAGLSLRESIPLGNLSKHSADTGPYRMDVLARFAVLPPISLAEPMTGMTSRLAISLDAHGVPSGAVHSLEVADGESGWVGTITYSFVDVGQVTVRAPTVGRPSDGVAASPPPVMADPIWTSVDMGEGIELEFPGAAQFERHTGAFALTGEPIELTTATLPPRKSPLFAASHFMLSPTTVSSLDESRFLGDIRLQNASAVNGTVIGERDLRMGELAREFVVQAADTLYRSRTVLSEAHVVTWTVGGSILDVGSPEADRFLNSLSGY
jgi:hypothetical protein